MDYSTIRDDDSEKPLTELQVGLIIQKLKAFHEKKLPIHFSIIGSKSFRNGLIKEIDIEGGYFILEEFRDGEELIMFTEVFQDSISIYKRPNKEEGGD